MGTCWENFAAPPTQLTATKVWFFFFLPRKRLQDFLEDEEEIDLPPRMAFKELLQGGAGIYIKTGGWQCCYPPTLPLAGSVDTTVRIQGASQRLQKGANPHGTLQLSLHPPPSSLASPGHQVVCWYKGGCSLLQLSHPEPLPGLCCKNWCQCF